jgi:hypothetical protein
VTATAAGTLWYAYAVVGPVGDEVREAAGGELELIGSGDAAVVAGPVDEAEFGDEALAARLNDREWLEQAVQAHDLVIRRLLEVATVVPLRFGSIHRDREGVAQFLDSRRTELVAALARLRGRVEVGVKVWLEPDQEAPASSAATGREYLERQRAERERRAGAGAELDDRLRSVHGRLLAAAADGVLNRPQARELSGDPRRMVMNAAYLVPAEHDAFLAEVERLRREHPQLALEVTGPWAPYNFAELPER